MWRAESPPRSERRNPIQEVASGAALWLVVALAFAVPLSSAASNVISALLVLAWLAAGELRARWQRIRAHPLALASIGLWLLIVCAASWSPVPWGESWRHIEKYARLLLVAIVVSVVVDEQWRRRALMAWAAAMLLTLGLSYVHALWPFPGARATRELAVGDHYIFKHHITQNVMMSVFAVVALAEAVRRSLSGGLTPGVMLWLLLAVLSVANILFFVQGRTGYLTLLVNLLLVAVLLLRVRRWALAAPALLVAFGAAAMSSELVRERTRMALEEARAGGETAVETSVGRRAEFARLSWELIRERPFMGWGTGAYGEQFCRVAKTSVWCEVGRYNPHNQWLFLGVQLGALGLIGLALWWVIACASVWRLDPLDRLVGVALVATFAVHSLVDSPLYIATESVWYPLHLALLTTPAAHWRMEDRRG
ncbi:MAG: O-antigen ligase family protein [Casimicrobiaceae bacterium]|nr:O-antigen ligase family protein [Casimicrobiaceae bacterium]MDW8311378.1 O-antigen ligase family protein [Burkholderiales bacterium]